MKNIKINYQEKSFEELKKLDEELESKWIDEYQKLMNESKSWQDYVYSLNNSHIYKEYEKCHNAYIQKITIDIAKKERLISGIFPECGDLYTVDEFKKMCKSHYITGDDGYGEYSDGINVYKISALPDAFCNNRENKNFSHVLWYNK